MHSHHTTGLIYEIIVYQKNKIAIDNLNYNVAGEPLHQTGEYT
jgi:hypothetical protein